MVFEIIVHYPNSNESKHELERRVAETHAQAVTPYIQRLPCPTVQKIALLKSIQVHVKNQATED